MLPQAGYCSNGTNNQINMFGINGILPAKPSWRNVGLLTGSLVRTFELPCGLAEVDIHQLACESTINLRFGISKYSNADGPIAYFHGDGTGLRKCCGC